MDSQRLLERIESGSRKFEEEFDGVKVQVDVESADQLGLLLNSIVVESGSAPENPAGALKRQTAKLVDDFGYIDDLKLIDRKSLRPLGIFTMMRFRKEASMAAHPVAAE